jgi:hypothetical protein
LTSHAAVENRGNDEPALCVLDARAIPPWIASAGCFSTIRYSL